MGKHPLLAEEPQAKWVFLQPGSSHFGTINTRSSWQSKWMSHWSLLNPCLMHSLWWGREHTLYKSQASRDGKREPVLFWNRRRVSQFLEIVWLLVQWFLLLTHLQDDVTCTLCCSTRQKCSNVWLHFTPKDDTFDMCNTCSRKSSLVLK